MKVREERDAFDAPKHGADKSDADRYDAYETAPESGQLGFPPSKTEYFDGKQYGVIRTHDATAKNGDAGMPGTLKRTPRHQNGVSGMNGDADGRRAREEDRALKFDGQTRLGYWNRGLRKLVKGI